MCLPERFLMMRSSLRMLAAALAGWLLFSSGLRAETLPLPQGLIGLNSDQGEQLLLHSQARQSYWNLSLHFVTQKTQSYCGIASMVMVLNAVGAPAPAAPEYEPYR